jgi:hypothetical protein
MPSALVAQAVSFARIDAEQVSSLLCTKMKGFGFPKPLKGEIGWRY